MYEEPLDIEAKLKEDCNNTLETIRNMPSQPQSQPQSQPRRTKVICMGGKIMHPVYDENGRIIARPSNNALYGHRHSA